MPVINAYNNNFNLTNRNLLSVSHGEISTADVACSVIFLYVFSGNILPLYPAYCVRFYTITSYAVGVATGVILTVVAKCLPKCMCNQIC